MDLNATAYSSCPHKVVPKSFRSCKCPLPVRLENLRSIAAKLHTRMIDYQRTGHDITDIAQRILERRASCLRLCRMIYVKLPFIDQIHSDFDVHVKTCAFEAMLSKFIPIAFVDFEDNRRRRRSAATQIVIVLVELAEALLSCRFFQRLAQPPFMRPESLMR